MVGLQWPHGGCFWPFNFIGSFLLDWSGFNVNSSADGLRLLRPTIGFNGAMAAVLALPVPGSNFIKSFLLDWLTAFGLGWIGRQNVIKSINLLLVFDFKANYRLQWRNGGCFGPSNSRAQFDCVIFAGLGWIGLDWTSECNQVN